MNKPSRTAPDDRTAAVCGAPAAASPANQGHPTPPTFTACLVQFLFIWALLLAVFGAALYTSAHFHNFMDSVVSKIGALATIIVTVLTAGLALAIELVIIIGRAGRAATGPAPYQARNPSPTDPCPPKPE